MIIPALHVNNNTGHIEFINLLDPNDEPVAYVEMSSLEDAVAMWYDMLTICLDNFNCGYDTGYMSAYDEMKEGDDY